MDLTIRQHMERLEARLRAVSAEIMNESDIGRRNEMESELCALNLALDHLRAALEIENRVLRS